MATKQAAIRIDYPKQWFVYGTVGWAVVTLLLFYLATATREEPVRNLWLVVGSGEGLLLGIFFVPPLFTYHLAGERTLRLRMGLLVSTSVPYSWVRQVKETTVHWGGLKVGIGVRYSGVTQTLYVTSEFGDLVSLRFDGPHGLGRLLKRQVEEVVMSASLRSKLVELVAERAKLDREA